MSGIFDGIADHFDRIHSVSRFRYLLQRIQYKGWALHLGGEPGRLWLQVMFAAADVDGGAADVQRGRKWLLSVHMTDSEIVQTAFAAVLAAEEHECRESFLVDGVAVLGPHVDVFARLAVSRRDERAYIAATPEVFPLSSDLLRSAYDRATTESG